MDVLIDSIANFEPIHQGRRQAPFARKANCAIERNPAHESRKEKLPPPDPQTLCKDYLRTYLLRSGYKPQDIDAAAPVLHAAAANYVFEKQITAAPPAAGPPDTSSSR